MIDSIFENMEMHQLSKIHVDYFSSRSALFIVPISEGGISHRTSVIRGFDTKDSSIAKMFDLAKSRISKGTDLCGKRISLTFNLHSRSLRVVVSENMNNIFNQEFTPSFFYAWVGLRG